MWEALAIVKKYVPEEDVKKIAQAVLMAQDFHELSWQKRDKYLNGGFYAVSQLDAARDAVQDVGLDSFWFPLITAWCENHWNDIQYWAKEICPEVTAVAVE